MGAAFVALWLPSEAAKVATEHAAPLDEFAVGVRRVHPADFHVTVRFLGSCDEQALARVADAIDRVHGELRAPAFGRCARGAFPDLERPRVAILELADENGAWSALESALGPALSAMGYDSDHPSYRPHVTLARIGATSRLGPWALDGDSFSLPGSSTHLVLASAAPSPDGRRYRAHGRWPLGNAA